MNLNVTQQGGRLISIVRKGWLEPNGIYQIDRLNGPLMGKNACLANILNGMVWCVFPILITVKSTTNPNAGAWCAQQMGLLHNFMGIKGFDGSVQYMRPTTREMTCTGPEVGV